MYISVMVHNANKRCIKITVFRVELDTKFSIIFAIQ